jgi:hypothetical protein
MSVGPIFSPSGGIGAPGASAAPAGQAHSTATPQTSSATTPQALATPVESALAAVMLEAMAAQDSLAPLLADLAAAVEADALPAPALATAQRILTTQTPLGADVTGPDLHAAVAGSGLFLEAMLAAAAPSPGSAGAADLSGDLKALLSRLAEDLSPQAEIAALEMAAAEAQPATDPRRPRAAMGSSNRPPPPSRDGLISAQPPSQARVAPSDGRAALTLALRQDTQAALARLQLSQIASLPKPGAPTRWSFELPVAAVEGRAMAQFEISRDDAGRGAAPDSSPTWRAKFSINVEPNGPVHAEITLTGGRTRVTLWGESEAARRELAARQGDLAAELVGENGADAAVRVLAGSPAPPAVEAGRLINRTS